MKKRYAAGDEVAEGPNKNIDDDTRERAMEYIRRNAEREEGERGAPAKPAAKPAAKSSPAPSIKPARPSYSGEMSSEDLAKIKGREQSSESSKDVPPLPSGKEKPYEPGRMERMARSVFPSTSFPGKGPESSMSAGMVGLPAAARGAAKIVGPLASSARDGWRAGEMEKAAARSEARYPRQRREEDRMEGEGPVRTVPPKLPKSATVSKRSRSRAEDRMAEEGGPNFKRGGGVKKYAGGGMVSASRRADGIAQRGKTKGRIY